MATKTIIHSNGKLVKPYHTHLGNGHFTRTGNYLDLPGTPTREKPDGNTYGELGEEHLQQILNTTHNVHEFLSAFMLLHGLSDHDVASTVGCDRSLIHRIRTGSGLPGRDMLPGYKGLMEKHGVYTRFEDLIIADRLGIVAHAFHHHAPRFRHIFGHQMEEMPPNYWPVLISSFLHEDTFKAQKDHPFWAKQLKHPPFKIESKQNYLLAVRHYLGLMPRDLQDRGGISTACIAALETGYRDPKSESGKVLVGCYQREENLAQTTYPNKPFPILFDIQKYNDLPSIHSKTSHIRAAVNPGNSSSAGRAF